MSERGTIRNPELNKVMNWTGMRWGNITPSDIDFFIEYQNECFIIGEVKYKDSDLTLGQSMAYERIIDDLQKPSILIISIHYAPDHYDSQGLVILSKCPVRKYRIGGKYFDGGLFTTKQLCDTFISAVLSSNGVKQ